MFWSIRSGQGTVSVQDWKWPISLDNIIGRSHTDDYYSCQRNSSRIIYRTVECTGAEGRYSRSPTRWGHHNWHGDIFYLSNIRFGPGRPYHVHGGAKTDSQTFVIYLATGAHHSLHANVTEIVRWFIFNNFWAFNWPVIYFAFNWPVMSGAYLPISLQQMMPSSICQKRGPITKCFSHTMTIVEWWPLF